MLKNFFPLGRSRRLTNIEYVLRDRFTTARVAGTIHGTPAEPTGGLRGVSDVNLTVSISGDRANFASGGVTNADSIRWDSQPWASNRLILGNILTTSNGGYVGIDNNTSLTPTEAIALASQLFVMFSGSLLGVGTFSGGVLYELAIKARSNSSNGHYFLIRGGAFNQWTLLYVSNTSYPGSIYPVISRSSSTAVFSVGDYRICHPDWAFPMIAYDTFDRPNGAAGSTDSVGPEGQALTPLAWSGGIIVSNSFATNPTSGSELLTNGNMETGNPPSNWTSVTSAVLTAEAGRISGQSLGVTNGVAAYGQAMQVITTVLGKWYIASAWIRRLSGAGFRMFEGITSYFTHTGAGTFASWSQRFASGRATVTSTSFRLLPYTTTLGDMAMFDDVSFTQLDTASIFRTVESSNSDVFVEVAIVTTSPNGGTQAGLVLNLDDPLDPQNYVVVYHNGTTGFVCEKCVNGIFTQLFFSPTVYVANAYLKISKTGTKYRVYYNNALLGSELTVSDVSIISNTRHGIFSTHDGNTFNLFAIYPKGTANEYSALDQF